MIPRIISKTVDMTKIQKVDQLDGPLYQLEESGHTFDITITGAAGDLSGTVSARFLRPDEVTEYFTGTLSGNVASITLPKKCYEANGHFGMVVFITGSNVSTAIYAVSGNVYRSTSDTIEDPTDVIPSLEELIAKIDDCVAATNDALAAADEAMDAVDDIAFAGVGKEYVLLSSFPTINCYVLDPPTLKVSGTTYQSKKVTRAALWGVVRVTANNIGATYITFVTDQFPTTITDGADISGALALGETGRHLIETGQTETFGIPSDCKYIIVTTKISTNRTPGVVAYTNVANDVDVVQTDVTALTARVGTLESTASDLVVDVAALEAETAKQETYIPNVVAPEYTSGTYQIGDFMTMNSGNTKRLYSAKFDISPDAPDISGLVERVTVGDKLTFAINNSAMRPTESAAAAIEQATGCRALVFVAGQRRTYADKTVIDITRVLTDTDSSKNMATAITPCVPGEVYNIRARGGVGSTASAICLLNANYEGIYITSDNALFNGAFTIPQTVAVNGTDEVPAYLIVNNYLARNPTNYYAYRGFSVPRMNRIGNGITYTQDFQPGYAYLGGTGVRPGQNIEWDNWTVNDSRNFVASSTLMHTYMACSEGDSVIAYGAGGNYNTSSMFGFVDADGYILSYAHNQASSANLGEMAITAPANAAWVYVNLKIDVVPVADAYVIVKKDGAIAKATGRRASNNFETDELFVMDGKLYKATSNIARFATITPGANATLTTVAKELSDLWAYVKSL